jgi:nucleotide-binding universal stress UspA family protein
MSYKSLLALIWEPELASQTIAAAAAVARAHDAHLDVLALGYEPSPPAYSYMGVADVMIRWTPDHAIAAAKAIAEAARLALDQEPLDLRYALENEIAVSGRLAEVVADRAAFADLVILAAPRSKPQRELADAVVEATLFGGKAGVLIVPEGAAVERIAGPKRIVLAWNQSAEALRAAKRALPLLKGSVEVDVTAIDPPQVGTERSDPGGALCQYLARHGVKASVTVLTRGRPRISEVLSDHVMDRGADLLVMGAYGHSRLRETILGGATRDMLHAGKIAVLMAH